ncbi:hypothetical protein AHF37_07607 [Paragonimus kellicotti]|nr:hypothetical protein AHF37_07607 [Paragonimus kellicotti]
MITTVTLEQLDDGSYLVSHMILTHLNLYRVSTNNVVHFDDRTSRNFNPLACQRFRFDTPHWPGGYNPPHAFDKCNGRILCMNPFDLV